MKKLSDLGYIRMAMPRADVMPLDLLYKSEKGVLERFNSPVYELLIARNPPCPLMSEDVDLASDVSFEENIDVSVESGLNLLEALAQLIKTKLLLKVSYNKESNIVLRLNEPKSNTVNKLYLDKYLQNAYADKDAASATKQLFNGELYVITEIIKSKSFTLEDKNVSGSGIIAEASVPQMATADANIKYNKEQITSITYNDDKYRTFGVMASRINYDKPGLFSGGKGIFELKKDSNIVLVRGKEDLKTEKINTEDGFLNL